MVVFHTSLSRHLTRFLCPFQATFHQIRGVQYVFVALQHEKASSYSILLKFNFCNFALWMPPALVFRVLAPFSPSPTLHATTPHQDGIKQGRWRNLITWSLADLWAAFPWLQLAGSVPPIFRDALWARDRIIVAARDLSTGRRGWRFRTLNFTTAHFVAKCHAMSSSQRSCISADSCLR